MSKQSVLVFAVLVLGACGGTPRPVTVDSGTGGGTDSGTVPGTDSGTGPRDTGTTPRDTGPVSTDPCAAGTGADALTTLGCNGGYQTATPAANAPAGTCTGDGAGQGTCTAAGICTAEADMQGFCIPSCVPGSTYVSTSTCPTGFRCFDFEGGLCFRDCDATHACPTGMTCDGEGSCVPE